MKHLVRSLAVLAAFLALTLTGVAPARAQQFVERHQNVLPIKFRSFNNNPLGDPNFHVYPLGGTAGWSDSSYYLRGAAAAPDTTIWYSNENFGIPATAVSESLLVRLVLFPSGKDASAGQGANGAGTESLYVYPQFGYSDPAATSGPTNVAFSYFNNVVLLRVGDAVADTAAHIFTYRMPLTSTGPLLSMGTVGWPSFRFIIVNKRSLTISRSFKGFIVVNYATDGGGPQ